jgi:regulator of protease activity HflC (stomatin/prohibitin superfamily)
MKWSIAVVGMIAARIAWQAWARKFTVNEGYVGILYQKGRYRRALDPGEHQLFGLGYSMTEIDRRKTLATVPGQEVLTADNITIKFSVLLGYRVTDAAKVMHEVQNSWEVSYGTVQVALRETVAAFPADQVLKNRGDIGTKLREKIVPQLEAIGIETLSVEVKDVMLPAELRTAFTNVIKAHQEGLATLERARAETAAMRNLANAARLVDNNPNLLKLRALQAYETGNGEQLTIIGSPLELLKNEDK